MASAGAPASDLAVQAPAATTKAVDLTAGATIREDPGPAAATAATAAAAAATAAAATSAGFLHCCHVLSSLLHPA